MLQLARPVDREQVEQIARQVHVMHVTWRPDIYEMPEELYTSERFARVIAERQLYVAKEQNVDLVILQSRSPSCGVKQIYDGTFSGNKIEGQGIFAQLLIENGYRIVDVEDL